jgi:hypothetical protein
MIGLRFYIYPNPTDNILNLNFWLQESADVFYSIVSFLGNEVKTETQIGNFNGNQNLTIDVSSLEKGIYYIKLRAGNAEQRKIFIKN